MATVVCSWSCLGSGASRSNPIHNPITLNPNTNPNSANNQTLTGRIQSETVTNSQVRLSYADRIRSNQPVQIDVAALPSPEIIGGIPTVTLTKYMVDRGNRFCEYALIGRLDFNKVSLKRIQTIATDLWRPSGEWKIIPLGKGFFMFKLDSRDDYIRIWSQSWKIGDQVLHFMKWNPEFDTEKQQTSNALIWVQFPKLRQQYWDYEALLTIGKGLGTPIGVDKATLSRDNGYFASVLIDIDMSQPIPSTVNVREEDGKQFSQEVLIPKLPQFCSHCKSVGHNMYDCRKLLRSMQVTGTILRASGVQQEGYQQARRHANSLQTTQPALVQVQSLPIQPPNPILLSPNCPSTTLNIPQQDQLPTINPPVTRSTPSHMSETSIVAACNQPNSTESAVLISHQQEQVPNMNLSVSMSTIPHLSVSGSSVTGSPQIPQTTSALGSHKELTTESLEEYNQSIITEGNTTLTTDLSTGSMQGEIQLENSTRRETEQGTSSAEVDNSRQMEAEANGEAVVQNGQDTRNTKSDVMQREVVENAATTTNDLQLGNELPISTEQQAVEINEENSIWSPSNQPVPIYNAYQLLGESDPIPDSMVGIMQQVDTVTRRMDDFLKDNSGETPHQTRSAATPSTNKNRNSVQAFNMGLRRSHRTR